MPPREIRHKRPSFSDQEWRRGSCQVESCARGRLSPSALRAGVLEEAGRASGVTQPSIIRS